jgi:hypothetical protein
VIARPGFLIVPISFPDAGLFGGVVPLAARTTAPANELPAGFTHESETDDGVAFVTLTEVTGPVASAAALAVTGDHSSNPSATAVTPAQARTRTIPPTV